MAGGGFMHRIITYVVNEILVDSLANNRSFQKFAVRTSRKIEDLSKTVSEKKEVFKDFSKNVQELSYYDLVHFALPYHYPE